MVNLLFLSFLLIPALSYASPAEEPKDRSIPILESTQSLFGFQANTVANRLDLFFADQRADDELARSRFRLRQRYEIRERALLKDDFQIRMNIRMPKLQEKFKFEWMGNKKKKDKEKAEANAKSGATGDLARNELNKDWQFRADVGVNASIPPKVFTRARLRKNMTSGDIIHRFVEEIAWYSDRDWEQFTTLDSDLPLDEERLIRFRNAADWKVTRKDFTTNHGPALIQRISDNDAFAIGAGIRTFVIDGSWYVDNYQLSATYRRNLYKQWIYMDVIPGLDFPKIWSFRRTPFLAIQLEALFGGI